MCCTFILIYLVLGGIAARQSRTPVRVNIYVQVEPCGFVVGRAPPRRETLGSPCHTTPGIINWKSVILSLWSVRDLCLTSHGAVWRPLPDKKKIKIRCQAALNVTFFLLSLLVKRTSEVLNEDHWKDKNSSFSTLSPLKWNFLNFFCLHALVHFTGMWRQVCSVQH